MTNLHELFADQDSILRVEFEPHPIVTLDSLESPWPKLPISYEPPWLRIYYLSGREQKFVGVQALELLPWLQEWGRRQCINAQPRGNTFCWVDWSKRAPALAPMSPMPAALW